MHKRSGLSVWKEEDPVEEFHHGRCSKSSNAQKEFGSSDGSSKSTISGGWEMVEGMEASEYDVMLSDINHETMHKVSDLLGVKNLSNAEFPSVPFPAFGKIYGLNMRPIVALACECQEKGAGPKWVIFIVDTGSPHSYLDKLTIRRLSQRGEPPRSCLSVYVQEKKKIQFNESEKHFEQANVLGQNAMKALGIALDYDWDNDTCALVKSPMSGVFN